MKTIITILASFLLFSTSFAQEEMDQDAMMKAWADMTALGDEHKEMQSMVGEFNAVTQFFTHPGAEPMESKGVMVTEAIMDGRYFVSDFNGTSMGMPFMGMGIDAYDKSSGKYTSVWIDNFGTGIMKFEGKKEGDNLVYFADYFNPLTKMEEKHKMVVLPSKNGHDMKYYTLNADGSEFMSMFIRYSRILK